MSISTLQKSNKYQVETEYLGTANNAEVEEEIITILKEQFLSKIHTDLNYFSALQSSPEREKRGKSE